MKPWVTLGQATAPDGSTLILRRHDGEYVIAVDGFTLMVSSVHRSESEMVALAAPSPRKRARVLVGGLGMGFTLRAALDHYPADAEVTVAELIPEVVEWNRGELGAVAGNPLDDPRTVVSVGDAVPLIRGSEAAFDSILLDIDNGPESFTHRSNGWLYTPLGLWALKRALRPGGVLGVWSATDEPGFPPRMRVGGFEASVHRIRAHGTRAWVFVGRT